MMTRENHAEGWWASLRGEQFKPAVILLVSVVVMVTWKYGANPDGCAARLPEAWRFGLKPGAAGAVFSFAAALVLLGLIPAAVVKLVFRERLADYGVTLGVHKLTFRSMAVMTPFFVLGGYLSSFNPTLRAYYPINDAAGDSDAAFALHAATYLLMYLGWEFHFRGFLQFGLRRTMGDASAVLVQVMASTLLHLGQPASETYLAILGGILWGVFAFRTRSLLSGLTQHYMLGLSLDWFVSRHA